MRVFLDADASPVKKLVEDICEEQKVECIFVHDDCHEIKTRYAKEVVVGQGKNAADDVIVELSRRDDVVISGDFGLLERIVDKGCMGITSYGQIVDNVNNVKSKEHKKYKDKDRNRFDRNFRELLMKNYSMQSFTYSLQCSF